MSSLSLKDAKDIADAIRPADNSFPIVSIIKALREAYSIGYADARRDHADGSVISGLQNALSEAEIRINELHRVIRTLSEK